MKRRHDVLVVIIVLILNMTGPASASGKTTRFQALCELPVVEVTIPRTGEVFINPYRLPVTIEADETTAQIVSTPSCIENQSEVPISVTVTVTGSVKEGSDMTLTSLATGGEGTRKRAFVYFEIQATDTADPPQSVWDDEYNVERHIIVRTTAKTKKDVVTIGGVGDEDCFGVFRLAGDCVSFPKVGWTETDGIDVEIVFTFTPLARPGV